MPTFENVTNNNIITASAVNYTEGTYEQLAYKNYGYYIEISGCYESAIEIVIPDEIYGFPVKSIGNSAFMECRNLTSVTIPEGVTSIGEATFADCSGLTSVTIPESVTSIGEAAFADCSGLTSVTIPESVTSIGSNAFSYTPWLESKQKENPLVIVNGILIDGRACSGAVAIPESVTSIVDYAFYYCKNLESVTISESVTSIGDSSFKDCKNLASVTIPESVTSIGIEVFYGTPWFESKRKENPLVIVGNGILIDGTTCSGDVIIPNSVTSIGKRAFYECKGLTSVTIPESVASIGNYAFYNCSGLTSIKILNPECDIYDDIYTIIRTATIYGYDDSTTEEYADFFKRKFVSLGKAPEITTTTTTTAKSTTTTTTVSVTTTAPTGKLLLGDANEDGEVNIADATAIVQHLGNKDKYALSEQGLINADCCNVGDGVTGLDALALQKLEANIISKLPDTAE